MQKIFAPVVVAALLMACHGRVPTQNNGDTSAGSDTITLADDSPVYQKIKTDSVRLRPFSTEFTSTGTVKAIPGQIAEITPPFSGRVVRSLVTLGQRVSAGTPLFELSSSDFFEVSKNYFQSLQNKDLAEQSYNREKDLFANGVSAQKDVEEAQAALRNAEKDYESARAQLAVFNIDPAKLVMGQPLQVVSPIAGEVVQSDMVIGQYVKDDSAPLAVVAQLWQVWVVAQVKEGYINNIHLNDKVEIRTDAEPDKTVMGRVYHINDLLDEDTRSVEVIVVCDNRDKALKPGMFTNIHFVNAPKPSVLIPSTALLQSEDGSYVFVQAGEGKFVRRTVQVSTACHSSSLVTEGLSAGEVIVVDGGIYLMAQ